MATSPSHTLGEFIGSFFEDLMKKPISEFATTENLYFDSAGVRKARHGKKVTWTDVHGSRHDLDFVIEQGGTDAVIGNPVAFIELAWRRYTKHSKNKVQEIEGAVNPICEKYSLLKPFKGAILSGQFTDSSINQLKRDDFHVLYIPFEKLVHAFKKHGLDIDFDEKTSEAELKKKYMAVSKASNRKKLDAVRKEILSVCGAEISQFINELSAYYHRKIRTIAVLPLHGTKTEMPDVDAAIGFISGYTAMPGTASLEYIEIFVTYNDGSFIQCQFKDKGQAIAFLERLR